MIPMQLNDGKLFRQQNYIDLTSYDANSGGVIKVDNPAKGEIIGTVPRMGGMETRRAIEAANRALGPWRTMMAGERARIPRRWFNLMRDHVDGLALVMTLEESKRLYGDTIPAHQADKRIMVLREPIGVCCAITSWNSPPP